MRDAEPIASAGHPPRGGERPLRAHGRRGRLKIFFGFAHGVGKTHALLTAAARLRGEGVNVVVGTLAAHGRPELADLARDLETLPRLAADAARFDLEAALRRRPEVLVLDELAHDNAPGARHRTRWQDVLELCDAGIDVYTTLNVDEVDSLVDVVTELTEHAPEHTVPDHVLDRAAELELVDVPPEVLLERLEDGKIHVPEAFAAAPEQLFQRGRLLALRELALRRTAERVDVDVRAYRDEHAEAPPSRARAPLSERILVCVSASPGSAHLVRAARRMAAGLRAPWVAASVDVSTVARTSPADAERLDAHLRLAESLGAEVVRLTGVRIGAALIDYARRHHVTRIVLGKPTHAPLRDRLRGSLLDELVRESGGIDVHVISGDESDAPRARPRPERVRTPWYRFASALVLVALATALGAAGRDVFAQADVVMLYLLVIMVAGAWLGIAPSLAAAALSVASYDFFFVPPYYTFAVHDTRHVLTFLVMFGVGGVIGGLTVRLRRETYRARQREARTGALYALSRDLGRALDARAVAEAIADHAAQAFECGAAVLELGPPDEPLRVVAESATSARDDTLFEVARWVLAHGREAGRGTDTLATAAATCWPLGTTGARPLAVLALVPGARALEQRHDAELVAAFTRQASVALERARLAGEAESALLRARAEETRSALLSTVSHDLRTPLAAITGAATALRDDGDAVAPDDRRELIGTICDEAERLERLVGNLLDMTRFEAGAVVVKRDWVPVDELVGAALGRLERQLEGRPVVVDVPSGLPFAAVDPVLVGQLYVNLLENALHYTPAASELTLSARHDGKVLELSVADRGPGLPPGAEERVFEKFYRGPASASAALGAGLGLATCRAIAEAHGGTITAENRAGGGALFRVRLPAAEGPPEDPVPAPGALAESAPEPQPPCGAHRRTRSPRSPDGTARA